MGVKMVKQQQVEDKKKWLSGRQKRSNIVNSDLCPVNLLKHTHKSVKNRPFLGVI